jgi:hypothetical protein
LDVVHGVFICGAMAMGQRSIMWMINGNPDGDDYRSIDGKGNGATGQQGQWQWKWGNNRRQNNVDVYFMARVLNVMYCG